MSKTHITVFLMYIHIQLNFTTHYIRLSLNSKYEHELIVHCPLHSYLDAHLNELLF